MIRYTIAARNLYTIAATLIVKRIPFEFVAHRAYCDKANASEYGRSVIVFSLKEDGLSFADIVYSLNAKYNSTFDITILKEEHYEQV